MPQIITEDQKKKLADEKVFQVAPIRQVAEFGPITFPNVCPERDVSAYLSSKICTSEQRGAPNPDCVPGIVPELMARRRMLEMAEERLKKVRSVSIGRKVTLNKDWKLVNNLQEQLRESMFSFENFIKENMEKRERAEKKIHEELVVQDVRRENIANLVYQMRRLHEVKKIFESNIRAFKIYENYLQKVVGISEYKDVNKVMQRFSALQEAKETSFNRSQEIMYLIEESMGALRRTSEENGFVIIGLKNKLCDLQIRFGEAQKDALLWETTVTSVRDQCRIRFENRNTVKQVCQGLYELMCRRKGQTGQLRFMKESEQENQMISIAKTLQEMEKIIRGVLRDGARAEKTKHRGRKLLKQSSIVGKVPLAPNLNETQK